MKTKTRPNFVIALAFASILGFLGIVLSTWFGVDIPLVVQAGIFIIIGGGLTIEGQIRKTFTFKKDGYTPTEISHIVASTVGIISIVVGLITLFDIQSLRFDAVKGMVALISIAVIMVETFFVD